MELQIWAGLLGIFILVVNILYWSNARARYIISYAMYAFGFLFLIPLLTLPTDIPRLGKLGFTRIYQILCSVWVKFLGIDLELRGAENARRWEGPVVLALNHQTALDTLMIAAACRPVQPAVVVLKKTLLYAPFGGFYFWLMGCIFIKKINTPKDREAFNKQVETCLVTQKCSVVVFVEGKRAGVAVETFLPFKRGAFISAITNHVPILPVVVSPYPFIKDGRWLYRSGKVVVHILPRLPTTGLSIDDVDGLISRTRAVMEECYIGLRKEFYS